MSPVNAQIRDCEPRDVQHIKEMCKDVYGGGDYMPRMIDTYMSEPEQNVLLVVERNDTVDGIACASLRGTMVFLYGLRIADSARKQGLARLLMAALLEKTKERFTGAQILASTTALANVAALKILGELIAPPLPQLDIFPGSSKTPHLSDYEKKIGWPEKKATKEHTLLAHIPGALDCCLNDTEAQRLLPAWEVCNELTQVQEALLALRCHERQQDSTEQQQNQQDQQQGQEQHTGWLPGFYEMFPADCTHTAKALQAQRIWVLRDQGRVLGVVCLGHSPECRRLIAGVVAANPSVVHSALLMVTQHEPHFITVVDRCAAAEAPAVFSCAGVSDCIPFLRKF